jgi:ribosomal protein L7/L12
MRYIAIVAMAFGMGGLGICAANAQAPAEAFKAAFTSAQAANKKAGELKNQWTTTGAALAAAKKAADGGDFDAATKLAKQAEAFATASIAQAERENKLWKESELR